MALEVRGKTIETDHEGYLYDADDWNEDVAREIAGRDGLELIDDHWKVIQFMRDYYNQHLFNPEPRFVLKFVAEELGHSDDATSRLYELFPFGLMQQGCKVAGLKRPRSWSTG